VTDGVVPPLGLLYLSSVLKKNKFKVQIIDCLGENPEHYYKYFGSTYRGLKPKEIIKKIPQKTKIVGISCMFSMTYIFVMRLCKLIKEAYPETFIVLGGAHVTALPKYILKSKNIDFVCLGESENTFLNLCESLSKNSWKIKLSEIKKIEGIGYKTNSKIIVNKDIELIKDIDTLPYPDWESIPMKNYFALKQSHGSLRFDRWMIMLFSRGCPYNCSFCNTPYIWKRIWRVRDPKKVVEEILYLQKKYGIKEVHFEDENISTDPNKLKQFCDELIRRDIKISWQAANGMRPHGINEEILTKMVKSGCSNIILAPESGSKRVLDKIINKSLNLDEILRVSQIANKLNLKTTVYFIMGLPGEKKSDIIKTIMFLIKLARRGVDECDISLFVPLPGSRLFNQLCQEKKIEVNNDFFESLVSIGDLQKAKSWSKYVSDTELKLYQLLGFLLFHSTKFIFHPKKVFRSILNIMSGKQELKTERLILSKLRKFKYTA
jgi:radical SAM superfamily enzyme YgiQ (UPF0313 family)